MCSKFCNGNSSNIVGYTPPTLHKGVRWFVDFTSLDPARGLMRRKRYYIKDSLSVSEKKRRASEIMEVLTKQLRGRVKTPLFLKNHKALTFTSQGFAMSKSCCNFRP